MWVWSQQGVVELSALFKINVKIIGVEALGLLFEAEDPCAEQPLHDQVPAALGTVDADTP